MLMWTIVKNSPIIVPIITITRTHFAVVSINWASYYDSKSLWVVNLVLCILYGGHTWSITCHLTKFNNWTQKMCMQAGYLAVVSTNCASYYNINITLDEQSILLSASYYTVVIKWTITCHMTKFNVCDVRSCSKK